MKVRTKDGVIRKAIITGDNPEHAWEIRAFNDDGTVAVSALSRDEIVDAGIQLLQATNLEWDTLGRAGFMPPYIDG